MPLRHGMSRVSAASPCPAPARAHAERISSLVQGFIATMPIEDIELPGATNRAAEYAYDAISDVMFTAIYIRPLLQRQPAATGAAFAPSPKSRRHSPPRFAAPLIRSCSLVLQCSLFFFTVSIRGIHYHGPDYTRLHDDISPPTGCDYYR